MKFEDWFKAKYGIEYDTPAEIFNADVVKGLKIGWEAKEKFLADNGIVEPVFKSYEAAVMEKVLKEVIQIKSEQHQ